MTLFEIETEVARLARQIDAHQDSLPTYGYSQDSGRPHIEVNQTGYHYIVIERGDVLEHRTTRDAQELLYHIFNAVTAELALRHVLAQNVESEDSRRLAFRREIELLSILSPEWADRRSREIQKILKEHPFDDAGGARAVLIKNLRDQGYSAEEAREIGRKQFPFSEK